MNIDSVVDLLADEKNIYNVALEENHGDATACRSNLTEIFNKAATFLFNDTDIWDREELQEALGEAIQDRGNFVCLLGGKSTGKTLLIKNMEKLNMNNVFRVNLRLEGKNILNGLTTVFEERRKYYLNLNKQKNLKLGVAMGLFTRIFYRPSSLEFNTIKDFTDALLDISVAKQPLKIVIGELLKSVKGNVTIIIDEANLAFDITSATSQEDIANKVEALALFTSLTKENKQV